MWFSIKTPKDQSYTSSVGSRASFWPTLKLMHAAGSQATALNCFRVQNVQFSDFPSYGTVFQTGAKDNLSSLKLPWHEARHSGIKNKKTKKKSVPVHEYTKVNIWANINKTLNIKVLSCVVYLFPSPIFSGTEWFYSWKYLLLSACKARASVWKVRHIWPQ